MHTFRTAATTAIATAVFTLLYACGDAPPPVEVNAPAAEPSAPPIPELPAEPPPADPAAPEPPPAAEPMAVARPAPSPEPTPVAPRPAPRPKRTAVAESAAKSTKPAPAPVAPAPVAPAPPVVAAKPTPPCGGDGQPMCPLQRWMDRNMQPPFDSENLPKLAVALRKAAKFVPDPSWNSGARGWATLATAGATAAEAGDFATARKSCKGCHRAWRKRYKAEHRKRSVP